MVPGGRADGGGDLANAGRVREDGLGRTGPGPLRLVGGAAPGEQWRGARARAGGALRAGDRAEPEHRAAGVAEDVRRAAGRAEPRARLEPAGRPGAGPGAAAGALQGLHRRGAAAGRPRGRAGRAAADRGVPRAARRGGGGAQPRRRRGGAGGGGPRGAAAGTGLRHGAGSGERAAVAAERSDLWQGLRCRAA